MSITTKVLKETREVIKNYNMICKGDTVVLGVSGGADSVMLLHVLNTLKSEYDLTLKVAHVNHKIRKGAAESDAEFVRTLCKDMGIPFFLKEAFIPNLAKEWGVGEEEAGRKVRYGFFEELAGCNGKIATAHNANDNVETILMRMMRGTGVTGLAGISYKRGNIIRPILGISREDIETYICENGLSHITDGTNLESIYTRNKVRLELIPFMQNTFNPNLIDTITENILTYREDAEYFEKESERVYYSMMYRDDCDSPVKLEREGFYNLAPSIAKRVIIKAIKEAKNMEQIGISSARIEEIYQGIDSKVGSIFVLNDDYQVRVDYDYIVFERVVKNEISTNCYHFILRDGEACVDLPAFGVKLQMEVVNTDFIDNSANTCYFPVKQFLDTVVTIRTRNEGDLFQVEKNKHKKLNRVFTDKKVSSVDRDFVPCLCQGNKVFWAIGKFATRFEKREGTFVKITVC